jgi:hypothetical protein
MELENTMLSEVSHVQAEVCFCLFVCSVEVWTQGLTLVSHIQKDKGHVFFSYLWMIDWIQIQVSSYIHVNISKCFQKWDC